MPLDGISKYEVSPMQYDIPVNDVTEWCLDDIKMDLESKERCDDVVKGLLTCTNYRMFVILPLKRHPFTDESFDVLFMIDTGAPYVYLTDEVMRRLSRGPDGSVVPGCTSISIAGVQTSDYYASHSRFSHVSILGQRFLAHARWTMNVDYDTRVFTLEKKFETHDGLLLPHL
jgi:hypothetical protein